MLSALSQFFGQLMDQTVTWIQLHPHWANLAIFVTAALESLAIVGLFLPGAVIMFGIGAIVATGALELGPTLLWAAAGAVLGDGVSFWLGRHYHQRLRVMWPFRQYPRLVNHGVYFFHKHGGKSVVLARFVGPVRPILPAVAGMLNMPPLRFLTVNLLSALLWAPAYILPGVAFGASVGLAAEVAGRLALLLILLLGLLWLSGWLTYRLVRWLYPHANRLLNRIQAWSRGHPVIAPLAGALLDPDHPEARGLAVLAMLLGVASLLFATLLTGFLSGTDALVHAAMMELRTPLADRLMVLITELGDATVLLGVLVGTCLWLLAGRHWRATVHWVAAFAVAAVLVRLLKLWIQAPRPMALYEGISTYAFPSSHATLATVCYGFLAVIVARELRGPWRWLPYTLASLLVSLIAFSRLYLGAHWLSDVLGGLSLGLATVALFGIAYRRHPAEPLSPAGTSAVFAILLAGITAFYASQRLDTDLARYQPQTGVERMAAATWWDIGWAALPDHRADIANRRTQPLNLQYAGELAALERELATRGWARPPALDWQRALLWLSPQSDPSKLPVLPQVHDGHHESLRLIRHQNGQLFVLRLWPSDFALSGPDRPLWVGSSSELRLREGLLLRWLETAPDFDTPLDRLQAALAPPLEWRVVRAPPEARHPGWSGRVLLVREGQGAVDSGKTERHGRH